MMTHHYDTKYYYFYTGYTMWAARMVFRASMCCVIYTQIPNDLHDVGTWFFVLFRTPPNKVTHCDTK